MTTLAASHSRILTASSRITWVGIGLIVVLFCAPLFVGLDRTDLGNDEALYSLVVDGIIKSGDWLTPRVGDSTADVFLEKPPLKYWIVALPIRLGLLPHNEFGLRFWDAVFGSLAFLYVFAIGRTIGGPVCGLVAVLTLFVHRPLLMQHGLRSNDMDAALVVSYCGGIYHFLKWRSERTPGRARVHASAVSVCFVLAFMTKFVAALFLPLTLVAFVLSRREDRMRVWRRWREWGVPGLLAIVLIAPWFLYQFHQFGWRVWRIMFDTHVVKRFTASLDPAHLQPWHYYFTEIVHQLRAWQTLDLAAIGLAVVLLRVWRRDWPEGVMILWWLGLPIALMSLLTSKLYYYTYPYLPPIALASGYGAAVLLGFVWSILRPLRHVDHGRRGAMRWLAGATAVRGSLPVVIMALIGAATLPITLYREGVSLMWAGEHPLRAARDCLEPLVAGATGDDPHSGEPMVRGPGVWAEGVLTHPFFYYLRTLGPWQEREDASDPTVYMHLYAPSKYRPVLLSNDLYAEFIREVGSDGPALIERAARKAGMNPSDLAAIAQRSTIGVVRSANPAVLLLPGPYGMCATEQVTGALR
jgi:4-amino-4-deoxy-L-arabinose transferase-like glycosyltransferase